MKRAGNVGGTDWHKSRTRHGRRHSARDLGGGKFSRPVAGLIFGLGKKSSGREAGATIAVVRVHQAFQVGLIFAAHAKAETLHPHLVLAHEPVILEKGAQKFSAGPPFLKKRAGFFDEDPDAGSGGGEGCDRRGGMEMDQFGFNGKEAQMFGFGFSQRFFQLGEAQALT